MWHRIRALFGSNEGTSQQPTESDDAGAATVVTVADAAGSIQRLPPQLERELHRQPPNNALNELESLREDIKAVTQQMQEAEACQAKIEEREEALRTEQQQLLMECFDGYEHPEIAFMETQSKDALARLCDSLNNNDAPKNEPVPKDEASLRSLAESRYSFIVRQRKTLTDSFSSVMERLRSQRERLEDATFRLQLRLLELRETQKSAERRLAECEKRMPKLFASQPVNAVPQVVVVEEELATPVQPTQAPAISPPE